MTNKEETTRVFYDELRAPWFAELLTTAADEHGAPAFAADLAEHGANPDNLELMADRWLDADFSPRSFADELYAFAACLRADASKP